MAQPPSPPRNAEDSGWPASTRLPGAASTSFGVERGVEPPPTKHHEVHAFDLCRPALALRAMVLVQGAVAVGVLLAAQGAADLLRLWPAAAFVGLAACGAWLSLLCALRARLQGWASGARAGAAIGLGALLSLLAWWPLAALGLSAWHAGLRPLAVAAAGAALAALLWAWLELRAQLWQPVDAQVRLAELQQRIRPHFLFNALNAAIALVRVDPARAEGVLEDLAQLFRVALADTGASVSLNEEIELAQRYLAIEQVRYGARLQVHWDIAADVGSARVPPLVLQPLVENAVRHGVEPNREGAQLWVQARLKAGHAVVLVSNTVGTQASTPGHGMALHNVRERLRLLHDLAGQCEVWREEGLFRARITVPM